MCAAMTIFVVTLASAVKRRQRIQVQLDKVRLPFTFFAAIDGRETHHPLFDKYDDAKRKCHKRYRVSASELGCYASHYLLWQACVERGEPMVVMEDDVDITEQFSEACFCAGRVIERYEFVRLYGLYARPYRVVEAFDGYRMIRYRHGPAGTQCYMIHPRAAETLLKHSQQWFLPVDDFVDAFWIHHVSSFALLPYAVKAAAVPTTIYRDKVIYDSQWDRIGRAIQRNRSRLQRFMYNWTYDAGRRLNSGQ